MNMALWYVKAIDEIKGGFVVRLLTTY